MPQVAYFNPVPCLKQSNAKVFWIFGDLELDHLSPVQLSVDNITAIKKEGQDYEILICNGEGHNIPKKKYELALYNWLSKINLYTQFKFKNTKR